MSDAHQFTIRRADGENVSDEYAWALATDSNDWAWAENDEHWDPTEYVIEQWVKVGEWRRTFGGPDPEDDE